MHINWYTVQTRKTHLSMWLNPSSPTKRNTSFKRWWCLKVYTVQLHDNGLNHIKTYNNKKKWNHHRFQAMPALLLISNVYKNNKMLIYSSRVVGTIYYHETPPPPQAAHLNEQIAWNFTFLSTSYTVNNFQTHHYPTNYYKARQECVNNKQLWSSLATLKDASDAR